MRALLPALVLFAAASPLRAEGVETVTFAGRVVDSRTIVHRKVRSALFYLRLKVEVDRVDSGRALLRGAKTIEVRCWQEIDGAGQYRGGHRPIPVDGAAFSATVLPHPEGFFEPAATDALVLADATKEREFPALAKAPSTTGIILGGIAGLLLLVGAGFLRYRGRGTRDRSWGSPAATNTEEKDEEG